MKSTSIVIFTLAVCAVACASTSSSDGQDTNGTEPAAGDTQDAGKKKNNNPPAESDAGTSKGKDSGKNTDEPTDPPPDDPPASGQCSGESTKEACIDCCFSAHETGGNTYMAAYGGCICQADNCATACAASLCNSENPTDPDNDCNTCINGLGSACQQAISSACSGDPDCVALDKCVGDSSCGSKQ